MKTGIGFLICLCLLTACTNSDRSGTTTESAEDTVTTVEVYDEAAVVKQAFPQLFQYLRKQDSTFSVDSFLLMGKAKLDAVAPTTINRDKLKPFQKYLIYNSDSSLALDLYSYNYIVTNRNGESQLTEAGPDAEAAVLDFKKGTHQRVFFGGPAHMLWDAKWTAPNQVLMMGTEVRGENMIPNIWQINLPDTSIQVFAYQGVVNADMTQYYAQKLHMGF